MCVSADKCPISAPVTLTSSVFVAEVREAPHVAQPNDGTGNRE